MNILLKSVITAGLLLSGSQLAFAQTRPAAPAASGGPIVAGLGVANVDAVVGNSNAFKVAQVQRPTTYKAQYDAAEARRAQITVQLQPLDILGQSNRIAAGSSRRLCAWSRR